MDSRTRFNNPAAPQFGHYRVRYVFMCHSNFAEPSGNCYKKALLEIIENTFDMADVYDCNKSW
jgi:hypothetical protein